MRVPGSDLHAIDLGCLEGACDGRARKRADLRGGGPTQLAISKLRRPREGRFRDHGESSGTKGRCRIVSRLLVVQVEECASVMIPTNFRWNDPDAWALMANDEWPIRTMQVTWLYLPKVLYLGTRP